VENGSLGTRTPMYRAMASKSFHSKLGARSISVISNCESLVRSRQMQSSKIDKDTLLAIGQAHAILVQAAPPPQAAGRYGT